MLLKGWDCQGFGFNSQKIPRKMGGGGEQGPCTHLSRADICLVLRLLQCLLLVENNGGGSGLLSTPGAGLSSLYPLQLPHILLILAEKGSC